MSFGLFQGTFSNKDEMYLFTLALFLAFLQHKIRGKVPTIMPLIG
jgi:hypothetical protein